jgi:hypothetical protein
VKRLAPFFKYFGSKLTSAVKYPEPAYSTIVEPFAGGAGYSLNYYDHDVVLYDVCERVVGIWDYLIRATTADIRGLPVLERGQSVDSLQQLSDPEKWLIGAWLNAGCFTAKTLCCWATDDPDQFWGESIRERIAQQVPLIEHWRVELCSYEKQPVRVATHFVDPPYRALVDNYRKTKGVVIDFPALGDWCQSLPGQVIVCEQEGATWLPFRYLGQARATRNNRKCCEVIWTNHPPKQPGLFDTKETP